MSTQVCHCFPPDFKQCEPIHRVFDDIASINPFRIKLSQDRTAVVTGASRGIGEAIDFKHAAQGVNIAFTYVSDGNV
jgi:hypothetical protein